MKELWTIEAPRNRRELRVLAANDLGLDPTRAYELATDRHQPGAVGRIADRRADRASAVHRRAPRPG